MFECFNRPKKENTDVCKKVEYSVVQDRDGNFEIVEEMGYLPPGSYHFCARNVSLGKATSIVQEALQTYPRHIYVVTGIYPNIQVTKKEQITLDKFAICTKDELGLLELHPHSVCFNSYEDANNKALELIQKGEKDNGKN